MAEERTLRPRLVISALWTGLARTEWVAVAALLTVIFIGFLWRLEAVVVADMDEGTYLYAGKLIAAGQIPYRDFMLAHPPVIAYLTGAWISTFGAEIMPARIAYMALVLLSGIPLYSIARTLARSRVAGLFAVASYAAGMLVLANMGRTVRLEPVMNAALIAAFVALLLRPRNWAWSTVGGALLGLAVLVKLVAIVPAGLLCVAELLWFRDGFMKRWTQVTLGGVAILVPAMLLIVTQPHAIEDMVLAQLDRPGLPLNVRLAFVFQDFVRDPLIPLALAAAGWWIVRGADRRLRAVSLVAVGSSFALVVLFKTFFGYYLVQVLPWLSIALAAAITAAQSWRPQAVRRLAATATLALAVVLPPAYGEVYYRTAHDHVSSAAAIVEGLRNGSGTVYSMYPSFALWSKRDACGSYYVADSLIARATGRMGDDDFIELFGECSALILYAGELDAYPSAAAYVERNFTRTIANADYVLWIRAR